MKGLCGLNPFEHCITIASLCNLIYRTMFLKEDTIGIIPQLGYRKTAQQSAVAYRWLAYVRWKEDVYIEHRGALLVGRVVRGEGDGLKIELVLFPRVPDFFSRQDDEWRDHARIVGAHLRQEGLVNGAGMSPDGMPVFQVVDQAGIGRVRGEPGRDCGSA